MATRLSDLNATHGTLAVTAGGTGAQTAAGARTSLGITNRELVTSDRTYYVRTDGNDNNTGLVNNAGGSFLTVQKAVDVVTQTLHLKRVIITIECNGSTYDESLYLSTALGNGSGEYIIIIKNAVIAPAVVDDAVVYVDGSFGAWQLEDVTLDARAGGDAVLYVGGATLFLAGTINMYSGGAGSSFINNFYRGNIGAYACDLHLFGTACDIAFWVDNNSYFESAGLAVTIEDALDCAEAFAVIADKSIANFGIPGFPSTFTGSATGKRFRVAAAELNTPNNAGGLSYFPGDVAGTVSDLGRYDGAGNIRQKAGTVDAGDLPVGTSQVIHDTSGGTFKLYANIGGVLKSVALS